MQIGISTNPRGRLAGPAAARALAQAAEQLGYSSIWVFEEPPVLHDPDPVDEALDRLSVLVTTATVTSRVRIGAELRVEPWYPPALLARSLLALDVLSDGRLTVGLELPGSTGEGRGAGTGAPDPVQVGIERVEAVLEGIEDHRTAHAPSRPRRPVVLVSAADPRGLERLMRRTDGWHAAGAPIGELGSRWDEVRHRFGSTASDRRPELVVPVAISLTDRPVEGPRAAYHGDLAQIAEDLQAVGRAGADEVVLGVGRDRGLDETLDLYARVAEALEAQGTAVAAS